MNHFGRSRSIFRCVIALVCISGLALSPATPAPPPSAVTGLNPHFAAASVEFDVPLPLLKAVSYAETRWQMVQGNVEFAGVPVAFGVMALRGPKLEQGSRLAQVSLKVARRDPRANILAGAALLRAYADETGLCCGGLGAWRPVLLRYGGITESRSQDYYMGEIARVLRDGVSLSAEDGGLVASIRPGARVRCP